MMITKSGELKNLALIYCLLDAVMIIVSIFIGTNFFLNSQISFFCSLFILFFSIRAYNKKVFNDTFYNEDISQTNEQKPKTFKLQKVTTFFSPFKIIGYALLISGFFFLKNSSRLEILPFLLGILLMPLGMMIFAFRLKIYDHLADNINSI